MNLKQKVLMAARDNGISAILFRNALGRKLDLNVTESMCLSLLGIKGGVITPKELSVYTGLTTGSTTSLLDRLEERNIVKRRPNPNDRRGVLIEIHEQYGVNAAKLVTGVQQAHQELLDTYSDKELEIIADFLERFTNNVVEHTKKIEENS